MPLPASSARKELHTRQITCTGYQRDDGLLDVEARLTDVKTYPFENAYRGTIHPDDPIHDMWIRITVDEKLIIHDCIAVTDKSPFGCCPDITPTFKRLIGEQIAAGWTMRVKKLVGGLQGCTHLTDLLGPATTTIFQTMSGIRKGRGSNETAKPFYINGCHAWAADSEQVGYSGLYTGNIISNSLSTAQ
ncbi:MAG: hypothetical protein A6F70_05955 [Cycloclasticus sp. symbiont of Bathymodiolus heckerae]|nr:MAG: hypothetical protein A6F70_05955 [Cycloclasticus sp. symbiont of Bathymodiolus heckerae]